MVTMYLKNNSLVKSIPFGDPMYNGYERVEELPTYMANELMHFLKVYKDLEEGKNSKVGELLNREEANKIILESKLRYAQKFGK